MVYVLIFRGQKHVDIQLFLYTPIRKAIPNHYFIHLSNLVVFNRIIRDEIMRLAHLILAHKDPLHIKRLSNKLATFSDVFIHVDGKADISPFLNDLADCPNIYFTDSRYRCDWAGWGCVEGTIALIRRALNENKYDRLVFLQGLDYPLKAPHELLKYFEDNRNTEFIRACRISESNDYYFSSRCKSYWFYTNRNFIKRCANFITKKTRLRLRKGFIKDDKRYDVYWGCAQWALTGNCASLILGFHDNHPNFNDWFYHSFPSDELYFHTIVFNSRYAANTIYGGAEPEKAGLVNWRNLHYFEYADQIKIFTKDDYPFLINRPEFYIRKVTTELSKDLLDMIDCAHSDVN